MDLRRRTTKVLAGAGALLVVTGLSFGGGVAVAEPGPAAQPPADAKAPDAEANVAAPDDKSSDDKSSDKDGKSSGRKGKGRKGKSGSGSTDSGDNASDKGSSDNGSNDPAGSDTTDASGGSGSSGSTVTSATTAPPRTPPSTSTPTTRPTTAPPTTATTTPPTTASTAPPTTDTTSAEPTAGQYNGGEPYQATEVPTEESSTTTTTPPGKKAKAPASRSGSGSGSGLPPGIHPADPGNDPGNNTADPASNPSYRSPSPAGAPAPASPTDPASNSVTPAQSQRTLPTSSPAASGGVSDPGETVPAPAAEVSGTETERGDAGAARHSKELVRTGDATRRLILFGGFALLMGAVVVAFTGRDTPALAAAALPVGPARRRPRKELDGWEDGVPLAPAKRELARSRFGISGDSYFSADSYYGDELGV